MSRTVETGQQAMTDQIDTALESLAAGGMVVVLNTARDGEAHLIMAAQHADAKSIAFFVTHTSGLICAPMTDDRANALDLPPMVRNEGNSTLPACTVACDAAAGVTTGISAIDRATTLRTLANAGAGPNDIVRPGHVLPVRTHPEGVLARPSHAEAGVDLCAAAGLASVAVVCELVTEDCLDMLRGDEAIAFARESRLPVIELASLVEFMAGRVHFVDRTRRFTGLGMATMTTFRHSSGREYLAAVVGDPDAYDGILLRVHSGCERGDLMSLLECGCGDRFESATDAITVAGAGIIVYTSSFGAQELKRDPRQRSTRRRSHPLSAIRETPEVGPCEATSRDYMIAAAIVQQLGIRNVRVNADQVDACEYMTRRGVTVTDVVPDEWPLLNEAGVGHRSA